VSNILVRAIGNEEESCFFSIHFFFLAFFEFRVLVFFGAPKKRPTTPFDNKPARANDDKKSARA